MKPVIINVFGDKSKSLEPEEHRIHFPGGCIAVARTSTGEYWAHITVNTPAEHKRHSGDFKEGHTISKTGRIVSSRIDYDHDEHVRRINAKEVPIPRLPSDVKANHVAVKIEVADHEK